MISFANQTLFDCIKKSLCVITPWKRNFGETEEYRRGWNDCVKDIKEKRTKYMKELEKFTSRD